MDQRIQYTQTDDGLSIAYSVMGEGPPLLWLPNLPACNLEIEMDLGGFGEMCNRLAKSFRLIRYDGRGSGLSDRSLETYSLDGFLLDLESVVRALELDSFAINTPSNSTPTAIEYTARNPQTVSALIITNGWARDSDWTASPEIRSLQGMFDRDWNTWTETFTRIAFGWDSAVAKDYAEMIRASTTVDAVREWAQRGRRMDVSDSLSHVSCPSLVMYERDHRLLDLSVARRIASAIPDARLTQIDQGATPYSGNWEPMTSAIEEFLGAGAKAGSQETRGAFQTILFTDVEGSTALTERLGDARARELLREHEAITREALKEHGGSEVKTMGDGFMASFSSATRALECAVALQMAFDKRNAGAQQATPLRIRIGLNAGEPIAEDDPGGRGDLFGTAVNMAARIASKAEGGEILASNVVRELVAGKGFLFNDRGETELRGFEDPVRVYEVRWSEVVDSG
jgi:class 3 adenylate cyclase